jgi:hypothetical protein
MTQANRRRFQILRKDIDARMSDEPSFDKESLDNAPLMVAEIAKPLPPTGTTTLPKVASFAGSSLLVTRGDADVTPDAPPDVASPLLEVVVREHWLQKKLNALASQTIREWKHLREDDRLDLKQDALLRLCQAHKNFHGQRRFENVERSEYWRNTPNLGWRKLTSTRGQASYRSFAGGVFANAMRRYAEHNRPRFATTRLEDWDGTTSAMTDGTFGTLVSALRQTKDGDLLFLQAVGYEDSELASTNLRMRRSRAKTRLAQNLIQAGFEIPV